MSNAEFKFEANNWWELINLNMEGVEECPITENIQLNVLEHALITGIAIDIPKDLPSHSQSVERCIKLVTEASAHVHGFEKRHKHI